MGIKQTAANIVCGFIPDKKLRHRVRTRLNYDIGEYIDFARRDAGRPNARVRTYSGHGGMKKIIVVLIMRLHTSSHWLRRKKTRRGVKRCLRMRFAKYPRLLFLRWRFCLSRAWMF